MKWPKGMVTIHIKYLNLKYMTCVLHDRIYDVSPLVTT